MFRRTMSKIRACNRTIRKGTAKSHEDHGQGDARGMSLEGPDRVFPNDGASGAGIDSWRPFGLLLGLREG